MAARCFAESDILFLLGSAGVGKTYIAMALAYAHAIRHEQRITVSRPAVEAAGEHLGYLPGDLDEKLAPFVAPILDVLPALVSDVKAARSMLDVCPLAYMRGVTVNGILVVDEAQNATASQLILAMTRIGRGAKLIFTGDPSQSDLCDRPEQSDLMKTIGKLKKVQGVGIVTLADEDQQRNPIVNRVLDALG